MKIRNLTSRFFAAGLLSAALGWSGNALAHCDTLDGPVVGAARKALESGNVNFVLVWVQKNDEAEIRDAFQKVSAVRKAGGQAKELADRYFFETLVRIHRTGEGAPYAGLKPAGKPEPAIAVADQSVETGKLEPVAKLISQRMEEGLHEHFEAMMTRKKYRPDDVESGRAFSSAYVEYVHYVERLYGAAETLSPEHVQEKASAHTH